MNNTKFAFLDESGTPIISYERFYVITASICSHEYYSEICKKISDIRDVRCKGAQLKSSRIGKNIKLRQKIIKDLSLLPLFYFSCVIDKNLIDTSCGLQWRKSMYKYCQKMIFDRIYKNLQSIKVISDSYGYSEFMTSFEIYIKKHFPNTLFTKKEFCYSTPEDEVIIQASDFIGGTIHRCFDGKDNKEDTLDHIKDNIIGIHKWPQSYQDIIYGDNDELIDIMIKNHCYHVASEFIDTTHDHLLKEVCRFLLYDYSSIDKEFIFGDELLDKLKKHNIIEHDKTKNWLMQKVIAPLRDAGVLISACRDGYKIPDCRSDVSKFVKFVETKSYPYLSRLVRMRESIFLGTETKYDLIVESEKLSNILKNIN